MAIGTTNYPTSLDTATELIRAVNAHNDTIGAGGVDAVATTVPITDTTGAAADGVMWCGTEAIAYTGKTGTSFTGCTRGFDGTTAASHAAGDIVYFGPNTAAFHNVLASAIIAAETKLGAGSGGVYGTLITTNTFSASSSVSVDGCFTSTYTNYMMLIRYATSTTAELRMRLRAASADETGSTYWWANGRNYTITGGASNLDSRGSAGATTTWAIVFEDTAAIDYGYLALALSRPQEAATTIFKVEDAHLRGAANILISNQGAGVNTTTTQFDGFTLYPSAGTITGAYWVFGIRKS